MKTAISISDSLFQRAEKTAKSLGITRSALFSQAVQEFLDNHTPVEITNKLNEIYDQTENPLSPEIIHAQTISLQEEPWE